MKNAQNKFNSLDLSAHISLALSPHSLASVSFKPEYRFLRIETKTLKPVSRVQKVKSVLVFDYYW
jgi:hypothetical protein